MSRMTFHLLRNRLAGGLVLAALPFSMALSMQTDPVPAPQNPPPAQPTPEPADTRQDTDNKPPSEGKPSPSEDEKAPRKKKGAAGRIAEQQAAKEAAGTVPKPRNPSIAWIEFTEPLGWPVSDPSGGDDKLLHAFKFTDPKNKKNKAVLLVSFMPSRAGKTDALLKSWIGNYILKGGGKPDFNEVSRKTEINGLPVTIVELRGALKAPKSGELTIGQKLIAVAIRHPKGPFFIRCQGPADLIDAQREAIMKFIESVRPATPEKSGASGESDSASHDADKSGAATESDKKEPTGDSNSPANKPGPPEPTPNSPGKSPDGSSPPPESKKEDAQTTLPPPKL